MSESFLVAIRGRDAENKLPAPREAKASRSRIGAGTWEASCGPRKKRKLPGLDSGPERGEQAAGPAGAGQIRFLQGIEGKRNTRESNTRKQYKGKQYKGKQYKTI